MGTAGACTRASIKAGAGQRNSEGEWEVLTSFDKNKQIQRGGKVQRRGTREFELQNVKIHDSAFEEELAKSSDQRRGGKEAIPHRGLGAEH